MTSQKSGAYLSDSKPNVKLFFSLFFIFLHNCQILLGKNFTFFCAAIPKDSKDPRDLKDLSGRRIRAAAQNPKQCLTS